nr:hypothetical protein [Tanacetum cinerariifolium]
MDENYLIDVIEVSKHIDMKKEDIEQENELELDGDDDLLEVADPDNVAQEIRGKITRNSSVVLFCYEKRRNDSMIELCETFQAWLQQQEQVVNLDSYTPEPSQCRKTPIYYDDDDDEESSTPLRDIIISELPSCIAITHTSIVFSPKFDSLLEEFSGELAHIDLISLEIDETDFDPEEEICFVERLLYDNSSPQPPKELNSKNSDAIIESFSPSPIPIEDSDSLREKIDLFLTPDDSMPPGIENDDDDSKGDILFLEESLSNDSPSLPENESFHFDVSSSTAAGTIKSKIPPY